MQIGASDDTANQLAPQAELMPRAFENALRCDASIWDSSKLYMDWTSGLPTLHVHGRMRTCRGLGGFLRGLA